jgi:MFS transporter, SP family, general alpha glucoside:H+ symporter
MDGEDTPKPHPSEALEFVTLSPFVTNHLEYGAESSHNDESISSKAPAPSTTDSGFHTTQSNDDLFASLPIETHHLASDAKAGAQAEHRMTFLQGMKLYPKAIGWSVMLSLTIVMEGYDTALINSFYAFPVFKKAYGVDEGRGDYQISAAWQSGLTNGAVIGEIIGLFFNGYITERIGYRYTMIGALLAMSLWIFLSFFAFNIEMLLVSQILCGLSWGVFQTLTTTYAAEVMPVALRAYLTSNVNLCWLIGQFISQGVVRGLVNTSNQWAYRIPFALQWFWSITILIGVALAPESPWWLIRHGRDEDAKKSLLRLTRRGLDYNVNEALAMMKHTNEVEKYLGSGIGFLDCFKGVDLRRTEIACMVWIAQNFSGGTLTGYAPYFYVQAGFKPERAFDLSLGMYGLAIVGQILSWFSMRVVGRRRLYIAGLALSFITLIVAGAIATRADTPSTSWTLGSMLIFLTFVYDSTIGPVCYVLVSEIPSTRLRIKTVVLARVAYNLAGIVANILTPRMLNPTAWNWKGKACYLWAGTCLVMLVWSYFRLPEPKGLTYMELDILFEKRAKTRKFREFQVNLTSTGKGCLGLSSNALLMMIVGYFSLDEPSASNSGWRGYG